MIELYDKSLARYRFYKKIKPISSKMHKKLTNELEGLSIKDKNQINITDEDTIDTVYEKFIQKLKNVCQHDIETRITRYGLHKGDLLICINEL